MGVEEIPQTLQHRGFAGSHFTREHHESLAALHAVDQVGESFLMLRAPEQERRIRAHVEGILGETKEGFVHLRCARDRRIDSYYLNTRAIGLPAHSAIFLPLLL